MGRLFKELLGTHRVSVFFPVVGKSNASATVTFCPPVEDYYRITIRVTIRVWSRGLKP